MDLFTYLMAKKGQNTGRDLFSYLLGKNAGGSGTYTTFSGTNLNILNTIKAKIKNFFLNPSETSQDGNPTPENPISIHTISGDNNIKIENKNLFNPALLSQEENYNTYDEETGLWTTSDNGGYSRSILYSAIGYNSDRDITKLIKLGIGTYTIKFFDFVNNTGSVNSLEYAFYDSTGTYISRTLINNGLATFTTSSEIYLDIRRYGASGTVSFSSIQIEQGSTATEYTPHQEQDYAINLGDLEYCKIGDYKDQIFKNTLNSPYYDNTLNENEWYMKKNIKKIVLDGTENWVLNSNYQGKYRYTLKLNDLIHYDNNDGTNVSALSDYFLGVPTNEWSTTVNSITVISNKRLLISSEINNVTDFKSRLSTHNTTAYFVSNASEYINITQNYPILVTQLETLKNNVKSYDDETNISQTNNDLPFDTSLDVKIKEVQNG